VAAFEARSRVDAPAPDVLAWHARPGALERLVPPWLPVRVVERQGTVRAGDRTVLRVGRGRLAVRWTAVHRDDPAGQGFVDEQVAGPFARWVHTHRAVPDGPEGCWLEDRIDYALPGGAPGAALGGRMVARALDRAFRFRHARIRDDVARHRWAAARAGVVGPWRVVVSGASGLVGAEVAAFLSAGGHRVERLVRRAPAAGSGTAEIAWDPARGTIDAARLEGADAVIHLAGESIAAGRWTPARKHAIRESRVAGTRLLAEALAGLARPPRVLVSASAVGVYGDRGDEPLTDESRPGQGYLAEVATAWEAAAGPARRAGIRVAHARIGLVVAARGGALPRMLVPYRLGAGGVVGSGRQHVSWIALDDLVGLLHWLLVDERLAGPVNAVAPHPVTARELTRTLGRVLRRPTLAPLPAPAVRLLFGEMGEALLLASTRALPRRLEAAGFPYLHPTLEGALRAELGR
jgi:uncharacterized protein (TIGR01777 family)